MTPSMADRPASGPEITSAVSPVRKPTSSIIDTARAYPPGPGLIPFWERAKGIWPGLDGFELPHDPSARDAYIRKMLMKSAGWAEANVGTLLSEMWAGTGTERACTRKLLKDAIRRSRAAQKLRRDMIRARRLKS